jgi:Uma2 family endonuclease
MSASVRRGHKISLEEFLEMDFPEDGVKREWVDGEIVTTPAAGMPHKKVQSFLHDWFAFFKLRHPQYTSYSELNLQLWDPQHAIPDFVIARMEEHGGPCREDKVFLYGPPDVVVEVLSPTEQWRDLVDKRHDYERGGVPEYWLFDPHKGRALFLRLEGGRYHEAAILGEGLYECASVPGLRLDVGALLRNDLQAGVDALGLDPAGS